MNVVSAKVIYPWGTEPIDTTIQTNEGGINVFGKNYLYYRLGNEYQTYFKEKSGGSSHWLQPVRIVKGNYTITLAPQSLKYDGQTNAHFQQSTASVNNNVVDYNNQFKNNDLQYIYNQKQLKENLIISSLDDLHDIKALPDDDEILKLKFKVRAYNIDSDSDMNMRIGQQRIKFGELGEIVTPEEVCFIDDLNVSIYCFDMPIAFDSASNSIDLNYAVAINVSGNLTVEVFTPYWWLKDATYPVYIDPTLTINSDYGNIEQYNVGVETYDTNSTADSIWVGERGDNEVFTNNFPGTNTCWNSGQNPKIIQPGNTLQGYVKAQSRGYQNSGASYTINYGVCSTLMGSTQFTSCNIEGRYSEPYCYSTNYINVVNHIYHGTSDVYIRFCDGADCDTGMKYTEIASSFRGFLKFDISALAGQSLNTGYLKMYLNKTVNDGGGLEEGTISLKVLESDYDTLGNADWSSSVKYDINATFISSDNADGTWVVADVFHALQQDMNDSQTYISFMLEHSLEDDDGDQVYYWLDATGANAPVLEYELNVVDMNYIDDFNAGGQAKGGETYDLNFVVSGDYNAMQYLVDVNLTNSPTMGVGAEIFSDYNLSTQFTHDSNTMISPIAFTTTFTMPSMDSNYYICVQLTDSANSNTFEECSDMSFIADSTAPSTSWDGTHATWQDIDMNVHLTCSDLNSTGGAGVGCHQTRYRKDTDASSTVSFSDWSIYDANIMFNVDGNWTLEFDSNDMISNTGDTNRFDVLIDKSAPSFSLPYPASDVFYGSDTTPSFWMLLSDSYSGVKSCMFNVWKESAIIHENQICDINADNYANFTLDGGDALAHDETAFIEFFNASDNVDNNSTGDSNTFDYTYNLGVPDVNVTHIDGELAHNNTDNQVITKMFSYVQDANLTIDFNAFRSVQQPLAFSLEYSTSNTYGTGTEFLSDVNAGSVCTAYDFTSVPVKCSWDLNTIAVGLVVPDNNYYINVQMWDGTSNATNATDTKFMVDNTAPIITIVDYNAGIWQFLDTNILISVADSSSGVNELWYRLDTDNTVAETYGAWTTYTGDVTDANFFFGIDGNWGLQIWSNDKLGNDTNSLGTDYNQFYALRDTTYPVATNLTAEGSLINVTTGTTQTPAFEVTCTTSGQALKGCYYNVWRVDQFIATNSYQIINSDTNKCSYTLSTQPLNTGNTAYVQWKCTDITDKNSSQADSPSYTYNPSTSSTPATGGGGGGIVPTATIYNLANILRLTPNTNIISLLPDKTKTFSVKADNLTADTINLTVEISDSLSPFMSATNLPTSISPNQSATFVWDVTVPDGNYMFDGTEKGLVQFYINDQNAVVPLKIIEESPLFALLYLEWLGLPVILIVVIAILLYLVYKST